MRELATEFATVALAELAESFIAEADLARNEAEEATEGSEKLRAWAWGVDQYSEQLLLVMEDVGLGFPVDIRHNAKIGREKLAVWASRQLGGGAA